ncbi:gmc oxidoreductase protein [Apiospora sp. TS-2023a]
MHSPLSHLGLGVAVLLVVSATSVHAAPNQHNIRARQLLGTSFGVPGDDRAFDYVVVGGGTAGLTIATRLVEQKAGTVAVVEAGTFYELSNGNLSQVPATDGAFTGKAADDWQPMIDWGYQTTPQVGALNESIHYARGKALGGSSARNYMLYHRGTKGTYQMWADQVGDVSYEFDNFLPYFEKSLNFTPPNMDLRFPNSTPSYDDSVLGDGSGPLHISFPNYAQVIATWAVRGLEAIGIPVIDGFNSGKLLGQSYSIFTIDASTGTRDSSETSFLRKGLEYDTYTIYPLTLAKRIIFDDQKKATGVSGVGPRDLLSQHDIPVVADLPAVGQGLQDHIFFSVSYAINGISMSALQFPDFAAEQAALYHETAGGIYSNPSSDVLGWEKVPDALREEFTNETKAALAAYPPDWPELEYISLAAWLGEFQDSRNGTAPQDGRNYASLCVALCAPRSRGSVVIAGADAATHPLINPNFLVDPTDQAVAIAGFKRAREFWESGAMAGIRLGGEAYPGTADVQTDAEILEAIRRSYNTVYHGASTCKMGKKGDAEAVVDSQGRVFGVQGLRVVDASAFPLLPPGHPQATVYALAEKIACDISSNC